MNSKKKSHRKSLPTWQLILIFVPLLFILATLLRYDHIKMSDLRKAVLEADASGDSEQINLTINQLRDFVSHNIVISIGERNGAYSLTLGSGPFYLEQSYLRDAELALKEAESKLSSDDNPYGNIYTAASDVCRPIAISHGWSWNSPGYVDCMTSEIESHPSSSNLVDTLIAAVPDTEVYRREFISPIWAPTFSGFALLASVILLVVIFTRFIIWLLLRLSLLFL